MDLTEPRQGLKQLLKVVLRTDARKSRFQRAAKALERGSERTLSHSNGRRAEAGGLPTGSENHCGARQMRAVPSALAEAMRLPSGK